MFRIIPVKLPTSGVKKSVTLLVDPGPSWTDVEAEPKPGCVAVAVITAVFGGRFRIMNWPLISLTALPRIRPLRSVIVTITPDKGAPVCVLITCPVTVAGLGVSGTVIFVVCSAATLALAIAVAKFGAVT